MLAVAFWVVGWLLLVSLGAFVLFLLGRSVFRRVKLLFRELETASERLSQVSEALRELSERSGEAAEAAVFDSPSRLRQQRILDRRR